MLCNLWWQIHKTPEVIYLNLFWQNTVHTIRNNCIWIQYGLLSKLVCVCVCAIFAKFIVLWCLNTPYLLTFVQNAIKQTDIVKCTDLQPSRQL